MAHSKIENWAYHLKELLLNFQKILKLLKIGHQNSSYRAKSITVTCVCVCADTHEESCKDVDLLDLERREWLYCGLSCNLHEQLSSWHKAMGFAIPGHWGQGQYTSLKGGGEIIIIVGYSSMALRILSSLRRCVAYCAMRESTSTVWWWALANSTARLH